MRISEGLKLYALLASCPSLRYVSNAESSDNLKLVPKLLQQVRSIPQIRMNIVAAVSTGTGLCNVHNIVCPGPDSYAMSDS